MGPQEDSDECTLPVSMCVRREIKVNDGKANMGSNVWAGGPGNGGMEPEDCRRKPGGRWT